MCAQDECENTKGVIRIRKSKKDRQHNGQTKKDKRSTEQTHKTTDQVTRNPLKIWGEFRGSGKMRSSCSTSGNHRVNLVTHPVISHE
jgi:hypothetical protein